MPKNPFASSLIPIPYPNTAYAAAQPTPPPVLQQLPKELLPREFQSALVGLQQKYGSALKVTETDPGWVQIHVESIPDQQLLSELQSEKNVLFGPLASRVQVIPPLSPAKPGIFLHLLSAPSWIDRARLAAFGG